MHSLITWVNDNHVGNYSGLNIKKSTQKCIFRLVGTANTHQPGHPCSLITGSLLDPLWLANDQGCYRQTR